MRASPWCRLSLVVVGCGDPAPAPPMGPVAPLAERAVVEGPAPPRDAVDPPLAGAEGGALVLVEVDGRPRRFAVREAGHATINRLSTPPTIAIFAQAEGSETLVLKLGGVDLDRVALPLPLRDLDVGGPSVSFTYVDAEGRRLTALVDRQSPATWVTLDAWSPADARLSGHFAAQLRGSNAAHVLSNGSFDVLLYDPFAAP